ncbi:hypothetical protein SB397_28535, partial [Burkholderia multivorans]|nr:hypothetical protein [Burkholderia multivorans]MEB2571600.1 hypothetical protein [Burkholderia multivorans]
FRVQVQALARFYGRFFLTFAWHNVAPWPSVYASHTKVRIGSAAAAEGLSAASTQDLSRLSIATVSGAPFEPEPLNERPEERRTVRPTRKRANKRREAGAPTATPPASPPRSAQIATSGGA